MCEVIFFTYNKREEADQTFGGHSLFMFNTSEGCILHAHVTLTNKKLYSNDKYMYIYIYIIKEGSIDIF